MHLTRVPHVDKHPLLFSKMVPVIAWQGPHLSSVSEKFGETWLLDAADSYQHANLRVVSTEDCIMPPLSPF